MWGKGEENPVRVINLKRKFPLNINYIKYPIAFNKQTEKLIDITDVTNNNKLDLICLDCKEDFVAVLNHKTPHFKHKPNSKCNGNVESYIHWVTKELFNQITQIELPEIFIDNLNRNQRDKLVKQLSKLINHNVPKSFHFEFKKGLKKNLSESGKYLIDKIDIEKDYRTPIGNVRIDIVATINNQELFIEPFYTNPIDEIKKRKLAYTNTPTLTINLVDFICKFDYQYNLEDLKKYLISKNSKVWIFNREEQINYYIEKYIKYVLEEIENKGDQIKFHLSKLEQISSLENEVKLLVEKIRPTNDKIRELIKEIGHIKKEIGIIDDES